MSMLSTAIMHSKLSQEIQTQILDWIDLRIPNHLCPLYSSVDIRDSGFKQAVIDTNLFPAGFNNLCVESVKTAVTAFKDTILARYPSCKTILMVAEDHTRNRYYLDNIRILEDISITAGFETQVTATLEENIPLNEFQTAEDSHVTIHHLPQVVERIRSGSYTPDLIVLNNDLSTGIPTPLQGLDIPILPSPKMGWHQRRKSTHFYPLK